MAERPTAQGAVRRLPRCPLYLAEKAAEKNRTPCALPTGAEAIEQMRYWVSSFLAPPLRIRPERGSPKSPPLNPVAGMVYAGISPPLTCTRFLGNLVHFPKSTEIGSLTSR